MKLKVSEMLTAQHALQPLMHRDLDVSVAWWCARLARALTPEIQTVAATIESLRAQHRDDPAALQAATTKLDDEEIEVPVQPLPLSKLDGLQLSALTLVRFGPLITDDSEAA